MEEDDQIKGRGHGRLTSDQLRGSRRPGEDLPRSEQPQLKIHKSSRGSGSDDRGSRSSRSSPSSTDSREGGDGGNSKTGGSSRGSSHHSHASSKGSRDEPRPSTSSKEPTPARSDGSGSSKDGGGRSSSASRPQQSIQGQARVHRYEIVNTRPKNMQKNGKSGEECVLQANYFKLLTRPAWNIFQYHVDFSPEVELLRIRRGILSENKSQLGGYLFDGKQIFTTTRLPEDLTILQTKSKSGEIYKITVKFVNVVSMSEWQSLQVLNLILRRAMEGLQLQLVGRNFFDAVAKIDIPEYRLQLWPGYTTSIRQHEKDILLCAEIAHKVMRTETLYDILQRCMRESHSYKEEFKRQVIGTTVLTDYNNKTYRIDDVDFSSNPQKTFSMKEKNVTFIDYYHTKYHIRIRDANQPLLISISKEKQMRSKLKGDSKGEQQQNDLIVLVPELCRATGLNDQMRTNFQLMRAMANHTRMGPERRIERLRGFNRRLQQTETSMKVLNDWKMKLDRDIIEFKGRILKQENIVFGRGIKVPAGDNADWQRHFRDNSMFTTVELRNWYLVCPNRSSREARDFIECLIRAAQGMRMSIQQPQQCPIYDDRNHSYVSAIESAARNDPQLIMCIVPNNNAERYSAIKKKTCVERAIPTQVMCHKTITPKGGNRGGLMSVATKVAIQMNCKLGAAAWMIELPLSGLMTIGYDICKSTKDRNRAYGALVATMDMKVNTKYYSAVAACHSSDALSNDMSTNTIKALHEYHSEHGTLPSRIILYRDSVGDGQINQIVEHEVKPLVDKLDNIYKSAKSAQKPRFAFIIVSKKINTRLFARGRNPPAGTVADDVVTLPERYDFYLVSQSVRQGTVSPTGYNVVHDTMGLDPDRMQILTYKNTHLYYNWSGTTRVPAVCQYAKKLATLVATNIHQTPSSALEKQLYFL